MAAADAIHASVALAADKKRRDYGVFCSELNRVPHLSTHLPGPSTPLHTHVPPPQPVTDWLPILGFCPSVCVCHLQGSEISMDTDVTSYSQLIYIHAMKRLKSKPIAWSWFCLPSQQILPSSCPRLSTFFKNSPPSENTKINLNVEKYDIKV